MQIDIRLQQIEFALNGVGRLRLGRNIAQLFTFKINQFGMKVVQRSSLYNKLKTTANLVIDHSDDLFEFECNLNSRCRILVAGGSGAGKSTIINKLNQQYLAGQGEQVQGVTKSFNSYTIELDKSLKIQIMDSPGAGNLATSFSDYIRNLCMESYGKQFTMIVFVWNGVSKRITALDICMLKILQYLFSPKSENLCICISHLDKLAQEVEETKSYVQKMLKVLNKKLELSLDHNNIIYSNKQDPGLLRSQFLKRLTGIKKGVRLRLPEVSRLQQIAKDLL